MEIANQITDWFSLITIIAALIISVIYRDKKELIPIQVYIVVSFIFNFIAKIFDSYPKNSTYNHIGEVALNIYSLLEIAILYYFLFVRIKGNKFRITIIIFFATYLLICFAFWTIRKNAFFAFSPDLFGIECLLITIPCLFYIYEILKSDLPVNLNSDINFIITCGILFYFSISIPSYFSWYNLTLIAPGIVRILILFNSFFYTVLFFSFMKAYLCPIPNQKQ
jgi:hypothetical protein